MEEIVQRNHMLLFSEKYIVGEVLNNLGDNFEASPDNVTIVFGYFDVNQLRLHDCRGDKSSLYVSDYR